MANDELQIEKGDLLPIHEYYSFMYEAIECFIAGKLHPVMKNRPRLNQNRQSVKPKPGTL